MQTPTLSSQPGESETPPTGSAIISRVIFRTRNAPLLATFYETLLGLQRQPDPVAAHTTHLKHPVSEATLITLLEDPDAPAAVRQAPGLFHVAFLFPELEGWKAALRRLFAMPGVDFHGAADHAVSWAVYLADPEGNGIELAWDKPENEWPWRGDKIQMVSLSLPLRTILAHQESPSTAPADVRIGHLHLQAAKLTHAQAYLDHLDLRVTQDNYSGAIFMARGRYHHHLAINTWNTRPGLINPANATGLVGWDMIVPGSAPGTIWTDHAGAEVTLSPTHS